MNTTIDSLDPFDYRVSISGVDSFKKLEQDIIHTFWPGVEEDEEGEGDVLVEDMIEINFCKGTKEVVKTFSQ